MIVNKIIEAVADAKHTEPDELDIVLQNWIEMEAIRRLANHDSASWTLRFEIPEHVVTVTSEDEILVEPKAKTVW